jgi:hypothetical protein
VLATLEGLDAKLFPSLALCTVLQSCPCTLRRGEALLRVAKIGYTSVYCERTEGRLHWLRVGEIRQCLLS